MVRIPLSVAVETWRKAPGAPSNAYAWYRQSAQRQGVVYFGRDIAAAKQGGQWTVDPDEFNASLVALQAQIADREAVQARIEKLDFQGEAGAIYIGTCGGYTVHGRYAFVWSNYQIARRKSDGSWYCRGCGKPADEPPNCSCEGVVRVS